MNLTEFDNNQQAIINPTDLIQPIAGFPRVGVACFEYPMFENILKNHEHKKIAKTYTANMEIPIYEINFQDQKIAIFMATVGAPACAAVFEEVIAMGLHKMILFGTCGVLDQTIGDCAIIIPTAAVRDEGTSFHYTKASDEIEVNIKYKEDFIRILDSHGCSYTLGKTWTTDGIYRETKDKMERRKEQGCVCVDMECSAMAAVAGFRNVDFFEFFFAADNLDAEKWDARTLGNHTALDEKEKVTLLALELAAKISK